MIRDNRGVGGFLEDLPVLAFVLLGVFVLVSGGITASQAASEGGRLASLESTAEDILTGVITLLLDKSGIRDTPSAAAMRGADLGPLICVLPGCLGWCASALLLHPYTEWLCSFSLGDPDEARHTAFVGRIFNAISDDGAVGVVEVMVIAW